MKKVIVLTLLILLCWFSIGCRKENSPQNNDNHDDHNNDTQKDQSDDWDISIDMEYDYKVEDINLTFGAYSLPGKLTLPITNGKSPVILLIPGSGKNVDMDETVNALKPFKELSEKLAKKGIASIRYNKISYSYPNFGNNMYYTIKNEYLNHANVALDMLRNDPRIDADNIFLLGHSFGSQMTSLLINSNDDINGAIIYGGCPKHIIEIVIDQLEQLDFPEKAQYIEWAEYVLSITDLKPEEVTHFYYDYYGPYWVEYNKYDWNEEILKASEKHSFLIMNGALDLNVNPEYQEIYQEILKERQNTTYKMYPTLNHFFVDGTNETPETVASIYKEIPDDLINDIILWVVDNKK